MRKDSACQRRALIVSHCLLALACPVFFSSRAAPPKAESNKHGFEQREGRLATPPALKCPRDNTTSFTGKVIAYRRTHGRVFVRVRTDEETTEQFTLRHPKAADASALFLINGQPFQKSDWKRIESRAGRLRPNMRATVWACYEGDDLAAELIDWKPPEG